MFRPRIRANKLQCPPPCKAAHQKFIPRSGSETNVNESPPAWEAELVIIFQNAPVRQAFCVLHTLYSSERDELDVYTASSPNDFLVPKESGKCSLSVAVVFTQISRSLQPETMTKTKELRRPDNEAVKINVWRPHSATRHSLPHTDNKKKSQLGPNTVSTPRITDQVITDCLEESCAPQIFCCERKKKEKSCCWTLNTSLNSFFTPFGYN